MKGMRLAGRDFALAELLIDPPVLETEARIDLGTAGMVLRPTRGGELGGGGDETQRQDDRRKAGTIRSGEHRLIPLQMRR
jgi:hypothetical protein